MTKHILITILHQLKKTVTHCFLLIIFVACFFSSVHAQQTDTAFKWPEGKKAAISLTFDDARLSQVDTGISLLNQYGVKATFFLCLPTLNNAWMDGKKQWHPDRK